MTSPWKKWKARKLRSVHPREYANYKEIELKILSRLVSISSFMHIRKTTLINVTVSHSSRMFMKKYFAIQSTCCPLTLIATREQYRRHRLKYFFKWKKVIIILNYIQIWFAFQNSSGHSHFEWARNVDGVWRGLGTLKIFFKFYSLQF